jgi:hypothetical protein
MSASKDQALIFAAFIDELKTINVTLPGDNGPAQALKIEKERENADRGGLAAPAALQAGSSQAI